MNWNRKGLKKTFVWIMAVESAIQSINCHAFKLLVVTLSNALCGQTFPACAIDNISARLITNPLNNGDLEAILIHNNNTYSITFFVNFVLFHFLLNYAPVFLFYLIN